MNNGYLFVSDINYLINILKYYIKFAPIIPYNYTEQEWKNLFDKNFIFLDYIKKENIDTKNKWNEYILNNITNKQNMKVFLKMFRQLGW